MNRRQRRRVNADNLMVATLGWQLVVLVSLATAARGTEPPVIYDTTVSGELAGLPGVVRLPFEYHLWNLGDDGQAIPDAVWAEARAKVDAGRAVALDVEPHVSPRKDWRRPVDPKFAAIDEIRKTHAIVAKQLAPLVRDRSGGQAPVWLYGEMFALYHQRVEDIVNDDAQWQEDCRQVLSIDVSDGKSLAELATQSGGGVMFACYVPDAWNRPEPWALSKCVLLVERQAAMLAADGIRGMPLMRFDTIGGQSVRPDTLQAMLFAARKGSANRPIAVWGGWIEGRSEFPKITDAQKALLR